MPHLVVEYSDNLSSAVYWKTVIRDLHRAALELPEIPVSGLRTRARGYDAYVIANDDPRNAFAHVVLRMGHGRSDDVKQRMGDHLFAAICKSLDSCYENGPITISLEIQEIHPVFNFRKSNMKSHIEGTE